MGENDISGGILYISVDGENSTPLGVVHSFNMETIDMDISPKYSETKIFEPTEMTFTIKLKTKRNRKTFKKWLMSRGNQRDVAEGICKLVGLLQGRVNYESLYLYILTSGAEFKQNYTPLYSKIYGGTKHET